MDYGNSLNAWSVGKYAKRSTTVHLSSKDILGTGDVRGDTRLVITKNAVGEVIQDPGGVTRIDLAGGGDFTAELTQTDGTQIDKDDVQMKNAGFVGDDTAITTRTQMDDMGYDDINGGVDTFGFVAPEDNATAGYTDDGAKLTPVAQFRERIGDYNAGTAAKNTQYYSQVGGKDRVAMFFPKGGCDGLNGGVKDSFASNLGIVEFQRQNHLVFLPLAQFLDGEDHNPANLQHLRVGDYLGNFGEGSDYTRDNVFIRQGNRGYRLELFLSVNALKGAGPVFTDNSAAATFNFLYTGVARFLGFAMDNGFIGVVLVLDDDPLLTALGTVNAAYNHLQQTATNTAAAQQVHTMYLAHPNTLTMISWNLRKVMPVHLIQNDLFPTGQNHADYIATIPNTIGYPEHKRCLIQVQSLSVFPMGTDITRFATSNQVTSYHNVSGKELPQVKPVTVGVFIDGVGVHNVFSTSKGSAEVNNQQMVGVCRLSGAAATEKGDFLDLSLGYTNSTSILDTGVLGGSPFGRSIRVRLVNLTSHGTLDTISDAGKRTRDSITNNPTHLTLRLLFLDDDDLPMR